MQSSQLIQLLSKATQFLKAGKAENAIAPLRAAALLQPHNAVIQHDLGLACLQAGQHASAIAALQAAITAQPGYSDAHFRLGIAYEQTGQSYEALAAYDRATALLPSLTEAWFRAGALAFTLGHTEEAIGCFRRAAANGGKSSFGKLAAVRALLAEEKDAEAAIKLRQLLALDKSNAIALDLLGNILAEQGKLSEARDYFARAVAAAPLMAGTYYDLVRCRTLRPDEAPLLAQMAHALSYPGLDQAQKYRVHLAIGKAAQDLGDHARAMQHFDAADKVRSQLAKFDPAAFEQQISRLISLFTPAFFQNAVHLGVPDATPLLITGMPRSGTTLLEQIISSHPDVEGAGELNFWNERGSAWLQSGASTNPQDLQKIATDYLTLLRKYGPAARHITDKRPFNFLWAGLIHLVFPNARILHCKRAAIDTALSIHQTHFNPRLAFPTGGAALVAYFGQYQRLMEHWQKTLPSSRFFEVQYEELVRNPEHITLDIITNCGLPWHPACLQPERNTRMVRTASKYQARQPIYQSAHDRWRRYEPYLGALRALAPS